MDKKAEKEEAMQRVKIMLCSLPASKPLTQDKPPKKATQTPIKKKEVNTNHKNEAKQFIPEDKREALKPKEPIKKTKEPVKKPIESTEPLKPKIKQSKPKESEIKPIEPKEVQKKPIKPEIKQTIPKEQEEIKEEKTQPIEHLEEEPLESIQEKESRLAQEYMNENIKKISKLLSENLYYPRSARKRNIQGKVMVKFKLSRSAKAYDIEVTSSQSEILSRAAIRTIENLSEKFPSPQEELILHVPITYKLNR